MTMMELMVRGIDIGEMEGKLRASNFREVTKSRIVIEGHSGEFKTETDLRKTFEYTVTNLPRPYSVRVHLGDPGEICLRIEGSRELFLLALSTLDVNIRHVKEILPTS